MDRFVAAAVLGLMLDLMILKILPSLKDSLMEAQQHQPSWAGEVFAGPSAVYPSSSVDEAPVRASSAAFSSCGNVEVAPCSRAVLACLRVWLGAHMVSSGLSPLTAQIQESQLGLRDWSRYNLFFSKEQTFHLFLWISCYLYGVVKHLKFPPVVVRFQIEKRI